MLPSHSQCYQWSCWWAYCHQPKCTRHTRHVDEHTPTTIEHRPKHLPFVLQDIMMTSLSRLLPQHTCKAIFLRPWTSVPELEDASKLYWWYLAIDLGNLDKEYFLFAYSCNRTSGTVAIKHCYSCNHILIYRWNHLFDTVAITYCYTRNNFFATNALKSITVVLCDVDLESIDLMLHVFPSILFKSRLSLIGIFYVW